MAYIGQGLTEGQRTAYNYVASDGQTVFAATYTKGFVDVYQNGVLLTPTDYTATNGTTVVFNVGANLNDEITIFSHNIFSVADTVSASAGGTFNNSVNIAGTLTMTGSILPSVDVTYDLGSASNRFRDLYLSGTTIDLGGAIISYDSGTDTFNFTTPGSTTAAISLSSNDTDDLSEGTTNLYYTNSRVDTFLGSGNATNLVLSGDLTVNGTTTYINTNTLNIGDNIITLNADETGAASQSAGIEIERGTDANKSLLWDETVDKWTVGSDTFVAATFEGNLTGNVTGTVSTLSNFTTDDLAEGANLYYTDARADARISAASINDLSDVDLTTPPTASQTIIWDAINSKFIPGDSFSQADFDNAFTAKSIGDLSDVDTATITPRQGQALIYDDNTNQWLPGSVSSGGGNTLFTLLNL